MFAVIGLLFSAILFVFVISIIKINQFRPSKSILQSKNRGIYLYEFKMPPIIEYRNKLVEIEIKEAFMEQDPKHRTNNLVLVYSKRGEKLAYEWNNVHYYYHMAGIGSRRVYKSFDYPNPYMLADTLKLPIRDLFFFQKHTPPTNAERIWNKLYQFGTITLVKDEIDPQDKR